jgi:hypothetical protein
MRQGATFSVCGKNLQYFQDFDSKYFEIKCKTSVHITAVVCIFKEWNGHSGYIPLSNFRESDGTYTTP